MRHRIDLAWAASGMVTIAVTAALVAAAFDASGGRAPAVAAGLVVGLVSLVAAVAAEEASKRARGRVAAAWRLLAVGACATGAGGLLRVLPALGDRRPGATPLAELAALAGAGSLTAAAVLLQPSEIRWAGRRALLDGALAASVVGFLTWITVLRQGSALAGTGFLTAATLTLLPLVDVAYCTAILTRRDVTATRTAPDAGGSSASLLGVGLALLAGHLLALLTLVGTASAWPASGASVAAGMLCLALSAAVFDFDPSVRPEVSRHAGPSAGVEAERAELQVAKRHVSAIVLPTLATVAAMLGTALLAAATTVRVSSLLLLALLAALVLARRVLVVIDNAALVRVLDERVARRAQQAAAREQYYRTLVQNASDALAVVGPDGRVVHASGNVWAVLGWTVEALEGKRLLHIVHPDERRNVLEAGAVIRDDPRHTHLVECRIVGEDGQVRVVETTIANLLGDPLINGLVCAARDVSDRQLLEQEREIAAYTDYLTGLANRSMLLRQLDDAIIASHRRGRIVGLVFLDLDGFKKVNDTMGHQAGDLVLQEVARRITDAVRPTDLPARLGGDEFAVLLHDLEDPSDLGIVTGRLTHALNEPLEVEGRRVVVRASVGAALTGPMASTSSELLRNADLAMYSGKTHGKGRIEHFRPELLTALQERTELEGELRRAMETDELELHFQPVVDLRTERIRSLEALIRWHHPSRGLLMPGAFIPLAEESDLIIDLDRWVLTSACKALVRLARCPGGGTLNVAANVSGRHLAGGELVNDIAGSLLDSGVDAGRLTLEVTETVAFEETTEVVTTLQRLRKLGCKIAIDDFGTGSSSLSKLSRLPVDQLKLDGSFIREITTSKPARAVIAAIVEMARTLHVDLVAEGIETPGQLQEVTNLGIVIGQGFLLRRPLRLTEVQQLLALQTAPA